MEQRRGGHHVHERADAGQRAHATVTASPSRLRGRADLEYQRLLLLATVQLFHSHPPLRARQADHVHEGGHQHRQLGGDQRGGTDDDELVQDVHGAFSQLESGKRSGERGGEVVQNRVEEVKIPPIGRIITRLFGLTHFDQLSIRRGQNSCQIHCINAHTGLLFIQKQHQLDVT